VSFAAAGHRLLQDDPVTAPSFFGTGVHPDLPSTFVHFTGRPRSSSDPLPHWAPATPQQRLASILQCHFIRARPVFRTIGPVVCFSEASLTALGTLFATGVTGRGPYDPWALLLDRTRLIAAGVRPVWYMDDDELLATSTLDPRMTDRRVRYLPGRIDWLAEREWRCCWGGQPIANGHVPGFVLTGNIVGVIVGTSGWQPPSPPQQQAPMDTTTSTSVWTAHQAPRIWWNGQRLVYDGILQYFHAQPAIPARG
jgi:hypothetical protein